MAGIMRTNQSYPPKWTIVAAGRKGSRLRPFDIRNCRETRAPRGQGSNSVVWGRRVLGINHKADTSSAQMWHGRPVGILCGVWGEERKLGSERLLSTSGRHRPLFGIQNDLVVLNEHRITLPSMGPCFVQPPTADTGILGELDGEVLGPRSPRVPAHQLAKPEGTTKPASVLGQMPYGVVPEPADISHR